MKERLINIHGFPGNDFSLNVLEFEAGYTLKKYISDGFPLVTIPDQIDGKPIRTIGDSCFFLHNEIENIFIPKSLNAGIDRI